MRQIDIQINKARITSYHIGLNDDIPSISATVTLYCGDKEVTTLILTTNKWQQGIQFDVPLSVVDPIVRIGRELEAIMIANTQSAFGQLVAPEAVNVDTQDA